MNSTSVKKIPVGFAVISLLWFTSGFARSELFSLAEAAQTMKPTQVYRLDWRQKKTVAEPLKFPLKKNQVYVIRFAKLKGWRYALTDGKGNLTSPREALLPGSVLKANKIGLSGKKHFELTASGSWKESREPELYRVWVEGESQPIRHFYPAP